MPNPIQPSRPSTHSWNSASSPRIAAIDQSIQNFFEETILNASIHNTAIPTDLGKKLVAYLNGPAPKTFIERAFKIITGFFTKGSKTHSLQAIADRVCLLAYSTTLTTLQKKIGKRAAAQQRSIPSEKVSNIVRQTLSELKELGRSSEKEKTSPLKGRISVAQNPSSLVFAVARRFFSVKS